MTNRVVILRGYPASGKSTFAKNSGLFQVSRDLIRSQITGNPRKTVLSPEGENLVTKMETAQITAALRSGVSVVVDNTNLRARFARRYIDLAVKEGADWEVIDFDTPVDVCVQRDAERTNGVGERVIRDMAKKFPMKSWPALAPTAPSVQWTRYEPNVNLPHAWVFDIDGTLALLPPGYSPYDPEHYPLDTPAEAVLRALRTHARFDYIVLLSGRSEDHRDATEAWLSKHGVHYDALHMRPSGDTRNDAIVKSEMFDEHVAPNFQVHAVYDDRDRVVQMWRARGIPCFQVAEGDF